jgi:hypothetical protein
MESWDVLRAAVDPVGAKAVAAKLGLSTALVYKWCQEPPINDPEASGARNPLDRMRTLYEVTGDARLVNWLCHAADGFFCPNPHALPASKEEQLLGATQHVVQDFSELLSDISRSIENDGVITAAEAGTIREAWEQLKAHAECFIVACERGAYALPKRR